MGGGVRSNLNPVLYRLHQKFNSVANETRHKVYLVVNPKGFWHFMKFNVTGYLDFMHWLSSGYWSLPLERAINVDETWELNLRLTFNWHFFFW